MSSDDEKKETSPEKPKIEDITNDGGVMKEIIKEGTGWEKPKSEVEVHVHYVGTLTDGTKFDSSRDRDQPFTFKLGTGQVIKGWDKVVETMKKGEICKVTLKPEYAYGKAGSPPKIPADATLIFEIELISWEEEKDLTKNKDGGILKKIIKEGEKWENPNYEAKCTFHLKVSGKDGIVYEDTSHSGPKQITLGNEEITSGLEKTLESMKKGEKAIVMVKSNYGYGNQGYKDLNIPPNTDLTYEIELIDFEKAKESWQLNKFAEKFEVGVRRKNEGNELFEKQKYSLAIQKYEKAIDLLKYDSSFTDEEKKQANELKLPCYLNLAASYLKEQDYKSVIDNSKKALEIDSKNVKGLWRRGVAYMSSGDWDFAKVDFEAALEIDPENKSVKTSYAQLKKKIAAADKKDRQRFQNLFQRLAEEEKKEKDVNEKEEKKEKDAKEKEEKSESKPMKVEPLN